MNQNQNNKNEADALIDNSKNEVKRRSILLIVSLALLLVSAVFLTYAWFTKMNSIAGIQFDVARWDFRANHQTGEVFASVFQYTELDQNKAAPGSEGYIPVKLSATASNTDIQYNLSVSGDASPNLTEPFKQRLLFFYRNGDTLPQYRDGYVFNPSTGTYDNTTDYDPDKLVQFNGTTKLLAGVVKRGETETTVQFYWRWVYDAREALHQRIAKQPDNIDNTLWQAMLTAADSNMTDDAFRAEAAKPGNEKFLEYIEEWDRFDTYVGKYPDTFEKDMRASVIVQGVEVLTEKIENNK